MQLILFFNGWGDINLSLPPCKDFDIFIINYPYTIPEINYENYSNIYVIGWSFGVYYAALFLKQNNIKAKKIAINGTTMPIGSFGIPEKIFNLTLNNLSIENLKNFYINSGIPLNYFPKQPDIVELKNRLLEIKNFISIENFGFDIAFLCKKDRIIPYRNQFNFYKNTNTKIISLECGHFPFEILKDWSYILYE